MEKGMKSTELPVAGNRICIIPNINNMETIADSRGAKRGLP
jgi:peroxiredoxin